MSTQFPGTAVGGGLPPTATATYDVNVQIDFPVAPGRLYAVPVLGLLAREILAIPHLLALTVLGLLSGITQLFVWIPVLFTGSYPKGLYDFNAGVVRWNHVVQAYLVGLTDRYPPFSLNPVEGYPVQITFTQSESPTRGWAIPAAGFVAKYIILIPHLVMLAVLGTVSLLLMLAAWVPVLFSGRYPEWAYTFLTGTIRWSTRVYAYFLGLTDTYPPFSFT